MAKRFISRGFFGKRRRSVPANRVPPGQYVTDDFPVLSAGPTPRIPLDHWRFTIEQSGKEIAAWSWEEFLRLPAREFVADIHCVTKWSKLDTRWQGVSIDTLLEQIDLDPRVTFVTAFSYGGYTTNLPLPEILNGQAFVAYNYDGSPLPPEHGGPARLVVPHLYFWKSAKWVRGLRLMPEDRPASGRASATTTTGTPGKRSGTVGIDRLASALFRSRQDPAASVGRPPPLRWQIATVKAIQVETPRVKTFTLSLPDWRAHQPGQHYDVRLTAPDGYQAQRSYSVASEPERKGVIDLTVEYLEDGEVSSYMHEVLVPGDLIEVRGPIGGYFVWRAALGGPLLLVAGGSGIVPLMSMLRHRAVSGAAVPTRLLYSSRSLEDVIYREELETLQSADTGLEVFHTLTRTQPPGWTGYARRIDDRMLREVVEPPWIALPGIHLRADTAGGVGSRQSGSRLAYPRLGYEPSVSARQVGSLEEDMQVQGSQYDMSRELVLDGNAVAGLLQELFGTEMTNNQAKCASCGEVSMLGALLVFGGAMGRVLRCPRCEGIMMRIVARRGALWLDMRGISYLRLERVAP